MSPEVIAAAAGVIGALTTLGVGKWIDRLIQLYGKRGTQKAQATTNAEAELGKVRGEYLKRIERLEQRLDDKDRDILALTKELSDARVTIARQETKVEEQAEEIAELRAEVTRLREHAS